MTIKELEEAIKKAETEVHNTFLELNGLQNKESHLEGEIDDLRTEFYEVQEQIDIAHSELTWKRDKYDELCQELSRRTKPGLEGTKLPYPVPMVCG